MNWHTQIEAVTNNFYNFTLKAKKDSTGVLIREGFECFLYRVCGRQGIGIGHIRKLCYVPVALVYELRAEKMAILEYYFDFVSPYTYLAQTQLYGLIERTEAEVVYVPVFLGGLHQAHDMKSPAFIPAKAKYIAQDCRLWAHKYDVPMKWCKPFPFNSLFLLRAVAYLQKSQPEIVGQFVDATFKAIWEDRLDVTSQEALAQHIQSLGLDPQAILAGTQQDEVKEAIKANTQKAHEVGLFGAPGFKVGDHVLFGQDRMHFVEDALNGKLPSFVWFESAGLLPTVSWWAARCFSWR